MEQYYGICRVSVAPLRAEPSDKAEISSQLLFGDHVEILERLDKWWLVQNAFDGYEGWIDYRQIAPLTMKQYIKNHDCEYLAPAKSDISVMAEDGSKYYLSPGSNLPMFEDRFCYLGDEKFEVLFEPFKDDLNILEVADQGLSEKVLDQIKDTALFFQNAPYLWGGRSLFGIDCSGFVQIVYKLNGVRLNRDAWQQAEQGAVVDFLQEAQKGDLAFFDNEEGRITHVGLMLSNNRIIHASAKVRIDPMDGQGIYNPELGSYTHKLRIIKRYI